MDPYSFTFTLMIRIVSADLPTEVVEIPGLSLAECVDAAREMEKRELVKPGATLPRRAVRSNQAATARPALDRAALVQRLGRHFYLTIGTGSMARDSG